MGIGSRRFYRGFDTKAPSPYFPPALQHIQPLPLQEQPHRGRSFDNGHLSGSGSVPGGIGSLPQNQGEPEAWGENLRLDIARKC